MTPMATAPERILFVHFGGIGDVVLAFPAIKSLRETFPAAHITMLVESRARGIGAFNPAIDEVLVFDAKGKPSLGEFLGLVGQLRASAFDLAITSGRSAAMAGLLWLTGARRRIGYDAGPLAWTLTTAVPLSVRQYAGDMYYDLVAPLVTIPPRLPQLAVSLEDRTWAAEFLAASGLAETEPFAVLHPGASRMAELRGICKTWEPRRWAALATALRAEGLPVVLAGGPDDEAIVRQILERAEQDTAQPGKLVVAHGKTRQLGQLAALIELGSVLIAVDSAPMHIGIALGTPTVGIFGPTDPDKLMPAGTIHQAVHVAGLACRPCLWDRRRTTCDELTCLKGLPVETVQAAVWRALPSARRAKVDSRAE